jgi:uncharacterized protein YkwD
MRGRWIIIWTLCLGCGLWGWAKGDPTLERLGGPVSPTLVTAAERQFIDLLNTERIAQGLQALEVAPLLVLAAREKSQEMHDLHYWGHQSPNSAKRTALKRVLSVLPEPPQTMLVGENLYYCSQPLVANGHRALMASPTHRKNILHPTYKYVGVGVYTAADGRFWATQLFLAIDFDIHPQ